MIKKGVIYSILASIACAPSAEYIVGGGCEYEVARSERAYGKVLQGVSSKEVEHVARILMLVEQGMHGVGWMAKLNIVHGMGVWLVCKCRICRKRWQNAT